MKSWDQVYIDDGYSVESLSRKVSRFQNFLQDYIEFVLKVECFVYIS